jgi:pepF/M3 family oligoendopeptidase
MTATTDRPAPALPRWDLTPYFPGLDTPEYEEGYRSVVRSIDGLTDLFDRLGVGTSDPGPLTPESVSALEEVIGRFNEALEEYRTLMAYVMGVFSTNTGDPTTQKRLSEAQGQSVRFSKLGTRWTDWVGKMDVEGLIARSQVAAEHAYPLRKAHESALHLMSPAEEMLAAELSLSGGSAWEKLHTSVSSQIIVPVAVEPDKPESLPMSAARNLAFNPDREVRRRAHEAELQAWKDNEVPLAAALNGVKGEVNTLSKRRKWDSALDQAIFDSNIDRATLDAMLQAAHESFPDFRRYMHAKARALGIDRLAFYDIFAPVGESTRKWEYLEARDFIVRQFGSFSDKMSAFAARAFDENWIDAEPRAGKRDGAFCMGMRKDESRVFANYEPSYRGMSTLAHELGHAYHNLVKADRTMLQKQTPMTLAETASIFCETIVREAALKEANEAEALAILEASLQNSTQVVVDITSRFLFESRVFDQRREREVTSGEFCEIMLQAQRETYGDGLDESKLHAYMWAVKPHYYRPGLSFYNFPYMFGLLFGLGLYARYRQDPDAFRRNYDDLLSSTGMDDAATLAARFGIDVRTPDFWRASLDIIKQDIDRFDRLVPAGQGAGK